MTGTTTMALDPATPIRKIALAVAGARHVFDHAGLDYCCAGDASLAQVCDAAGLSVAETLASIDDAAHRPENRAAFHDWGHERRDIVVAHIVEHGYPAARVSMANTSSLLGQVASVHGAAHPELREVETTWMQVCRRMRQHMVQERREIDPRVAAPEGLAVQHADLVELMRRIRALTCGYNPPEGGRDALSAVYHDLEAFEADLHEHVLLAESVLLRER